VDARDLDATDALIARGEEKLAEVGETTTLEVEYIPTPTYRYGIDFDLGDIVSAEYPGIATMEARIVTVTEQYPSGRIVLGLGKGVAGPDQSSPGAEERERGDETMTLNYGLFDVSDPENPDRVYSSGVAESYREQTHPGRDRPRRRRRVGRLGVRSPGDDRRGGNRDRYGPGPVLRERRRPDARRACGRRNVRPDRPGGCPALGHARPDDRYPGQKRDSGTVPGPAGPDQDPRDLGVVARADPGGGRGDVDPVRQDH